MFAAGIRRLPQVYLLPNDRLGSSGPRLANIHMDQGFLSSLVPGALMRSKGGDQRFVQRLREARMRIVRKLAEAREDLSLIRGENSAKDCCDGIKSIRPILLQHQPKEKGGVKVQGLSE